MPELSIDSKWIQSDEDGLLCSQKNLKCCQNSSKNGATLRVPENFLYSLKHCSCVSQPKRHTGTPIWFIVRDKRLLRTYSWSTLICQLPLLESSAENTSTEPKLSTHFFIHGIWHLCRTVFALRLRYLTKTFLYCRSYPMQKCLTAPIYLWWFGNILLYYFVKVFFGLLLVRPGTTRKGMNCRCVFRQLTTLPRNGYLATISFPRLFISWQHLFKFWLVLVELLVEVSLFSSFVSLFFFAVCRHFLTLIKLLLSVLLSIEN